ncbi:MAG: nuclear transport factor 2 family protein [Acidimicrobiales bacterium]|nr:nuclear transport factor 2 family protein [Acidimicrobiales bacterium]
MDPELQATVDHVAIGRLQAAYADGVTRRDWPAVQALFLPGAVVELDLGDRPHRTLRGSHELVEFVASALDRFSFFEFVILNAHIELTDGGDPDAASARLWMCELRHAHGEPDRSEAFGVYLDDYRRVDGTWRIAHRRYRSLARYPEGATFPFDR